MDSTRFDLPFDPIPIAIPRRLGTPNFPCPPGTRKRIAGLGFFMATDRAGLTYLIPIYSAMDPYTEPEKVTLDYLDPPKYLRKWDKTP